MVPFEQGVAILCVLCEAKLHHECKKQERAEAQVFVRNKAGHPPKRRADDRHSISLFVTSKGPDWNSKTTAAATSPESCLSGPFTHEQEVQC